MTILGFQNLKIKKKSKITNSYFLIPNYPIPNPQLPNSLISKNYLNFSRCAKYSPTITSNVPMYVYEVMGSFSKIEA